MKTTMLYLAGLFFACLGSGFCGAYLAVHMKEKPSLTTTVQRSDSVIQAKGLELVDDSRNVRARFSLEDNGNVILVINSKDMSPIVEMHEVETKAYPGSTTAMGSMTFYGAVGTPAIEIGTSDKGEGGLSLSTDKVHALISLGYHPDGDTVPSSLANWGLLLRGPDYTYNGLGVRTKDGVPQSFYGLAQ